MGFPGKKSTCNTGDPGFLGQENPWGRDRLPTPAFLGFPGGGSDGKESACPGGDLGSISALGSSLGGGHGSPLQSSCLEESARTEEPGGLQSMGTQRSRHDWVTKTAQLYQYFISNWTRIMLSTELFWLLAENQIQNNFLLLNNFFWINFYFLSFQLYWEVIDIEQCVSLRCNDFIYMCIYSFFCLMRTLKIYSLSNFQK